ncbi:mediator of RNA polymerase II transcription subunit 1-domain-containing protein [Xylariomycetidae sp. FL0641]|nr:mediator of RNA polymerase II transcription subunit 1-domain-containing protein [Xylariomycetidae sp. FL0641]
MSTPMRHGPSQQGRTPSQHPGATPQASTPFSAAGANAFSPHGPRSSPQQFKKSPAAGTSVTMGASSGQPSTSAGGNNAHSAPVNFNSPSAAAALGALGYDNLNLGHLGNLSVEGLLPGAGRANDEEERRRRLDGVLADLNAYAREHTRVSNLALERLANTLGLESLWEPGPSGSDNDKVFIIAGRTMGVEVGINTHVVHHVALSYNDPIPNLEKHVDKASAVLYNDLRLGPNQSPLTKFMTEFRTNMERLTTLDRLSVTPGLNCHEAIAGVYESLEKLHRWDVEKLRGDPTMSGKPESQLQVFALCAHHGCPLMHTRGRVGLSLDYWKERRFLKSTTVETEDARTWSILVECAPASSMVYASIRVSDNWIGPGIEKSKLTDEEAISATGPVLDWLEPANTLLPPSEEAKAEGGLEPNAALHGPKPPDVVFMATFDPPVVVPHVAAMEIFKISATNAPLSNMTFDVLLFPVPEGTAYDPSEPREMTYTQTVPTFKNPGQGQTEPKLEAHRNTLMVDKPVYGQVLNQVPFSHPKDLIAMLPVLRQYAFLSLLLNNSFKPRKDKPTSAAADAQNARDARKLENEREIRTARTDFASFMAGISAGADKGSKRRGEEEGSVTDDSILKMDMVLSAHPVPRLTLVFPFRGTTANVMLEIQLGGKVHFVSENIFGGDGAAAAKWATKLEQCEDVGQWAEFLRWKLE